ncbi:MAG: NAD(P)-dependent oxidoreductase [Gemmatimonadota bacterium]
MKKKVLFLGASGLIGPYVTPGLEADYDLILTDVKPHPLGVPVRQVDIRSYAQVLEAARGADAIANFTVVRGDPTDSFLVNTLGAWNVARAAVELGIRKIVHTGPQSVRPAYEHEFGLDEAPGAPGSGYYGVTKWLGREICRTWAENCGLQIISFVFAGLGPSPEGLQVKEDIPFFRVVWEDLQHACRLALELETVPGGFQEFNLFSYPANGKYTLDKARRILGFEPTRRWEEYFRRPAGARPVSEAVG